MENPCNTCLVKGNCTKVCPEKINYYALIDQAFGQHQRFLSNNKSKKYFNYLIKYQELLTLRFEHNLDISKIKKRKSACIDLENPCKAWFT